MSRPRIVVSLGGGLGNQLFQFAVALDLARNTDFGLDQNLGLPKLSKDGNPELAQFTLPTNAKFEEKRRLSNFTMRSTNFMLMMGKSAFRHRKSYLSGILIFLSSAVISIYLKEPRKIVAAKGLGYHELSWKYRSAFLVGYFQSYRWANNPETLEKLKKLKLNSESNGIENYRSISVEEKPLVVHIRLGDYTQIPSFGIPSDEYYRLAIEEHFKKVLHKKIWLFSNEPDKALLKIPSDYRSIVRIIDEVDGSAARTLEVMRMGYGYVIANSTYSWWGAFLSYTKTPLVIAPSPWFKGEPSPNELIPPYWQVLPAWPREQ